MKTYIKLTAQEVDVLADTLQHSDRLAARVIGDKIQSAIGGQAPCDMELIGLR